jgi:CheY-like chemotaxis protein
VLIVDDEKSVRTVAARMLERLGYTALIAGDSFRQPLTGRPGALFGAQAEVAADVG